MPSCQQMARAAPDAGPRRLEELTGVDVERMLPIPNIPDADFKEARRFTDQGMHGKLYCFSESDLEGIRRLWTGTHPLDGTRSR